MWQIKDKDILFGKPFVIAGILNLTPDSFFDGGKYDDLDRALQRASQMIEEGADIIDVGAESTRPGADDVPAEVQIKRMKDVVTELIAQKIFVSIDTRNSVVAEKMLSLGAGIINDVSGLSDSRMTEVIAGYSASLVIMHIKGTPKDMQINPHYDNVVKEVREWLCFKLEKAVSVGIKPERISLDPGIGFGKRLEDNLRLINEIDNIVNIGLEIMVGISRKSFIKSVGGGDSPLLRLSGSIAASVLAFEKGVRIFRTHDPLETRKALNTAAGILERVKNE